LKSKKKGMSMFWRGNDHSSPKVECQESESDARALGFTRPL
jgi:hypothetical protein